MATIQKSYEYHIYRQGTYLGELPNVISDFGTSQDINSGAAQLSVQVALNADVTDQAPLTLDSEDSIDLTAEDGTTLLTTERTPDVVGDSNESILIRNGNQVQVYEISKTYPNGKKMFVGRITDWSANFGGSNDSVASFNALSDGSDLANIVIKTGASSLVTQETDDGSKYTLSGGDKGSAGSTFLLQTFAGSTAKLGSIKLKVQDTYTGGGGGSIPAYLVAYIYQQLGSQPNLATDTLLTSTAITSLPNTAGGTVIGVSFSPSVQIQNGATYYIALQCSSGGGGAASVYIYYTTANPYASGQVWEDAAGTYTSHSTWDLYFDVLTDGNTTSPFTSQDPTAMLKSIIDNYIGQGGLVNYAAGTTDNTNYTTSYTFIIASVLEGIQKCLELAPSDWYWYADIASDTLYFKQTLATATYTLVKGLHILELNINANTDNVINDVYYTGGAVAGTNLFSRYQDTTSRTNFGPRLDRKTDNRVTLQPTLDILGNTEIASLKGQQRTTTVTVVDGVAGMDITLFKPGQTVGFAGFGNFVDTLILQIIRVVYSPESVTLTLGKLPKRLTNDIGVINNELDQLQTIANPSAPS